MGVQKPPYPPSGNASNVPMIPRRWSMPRNCEKQTGPKIRKFSGQSLKHHENIMKTAWKHHENIMETSWKHHGNIMKTSFNWRYQICVWVLKSVLDWCACVCVVLQNDMHYRMMVELMNWYVMVSCHVMLQKTPALVFPSTFPAPIRCRCDGATFSFWATPQRHPTKDGIWWDGYWMLMGYLIHDDKWWSMAN